jgi:hypothetical protein
MLHFHIETISCFNNKINRAYAYYFFHFNFHKDGFSLPYDNFK